METNPPASDLIRPVETSADADALLRMMETFCRHFGYRFDPVLRQNLIRSMLENPALGSLWLITHDGQPVGYVALTYGFAFEFGGRTALVDELFVEEAHRGAGRGRRVLQGIQQLADHLGVSTILLQTEKYNTRAKQLYESLGFVDQDRSTLMWVKPI
ncbi:GNAT family N-acetyltransferase [Larkinella insperata]|uniref:GNAT family N-acetyltransferase n=1 Tax=Larkinella insperata TaxID=332158 RepID=A0ABW3QE65_9BACT|nr:GNAT family N-acetyltransferase [Larkinella insperata]